MCLHRTDSDPPAFECGSLQSIPLGQLCDGHNDCGEGEDEMLPIGVTVSGYSWVVTPAFISLHEFSIQTGSACSNYSIRDVAIILNASVAQCL